ncbi:MAG TPA: glycosyl transferase family 2 [Phycisphaerales bacterium]|nr:glycosyl transferase family 2 [Phycisphaerales bacterium]|tara:strand:+ start:1499 stop:2272 length:774 start_codon:yes stop_codon:yes gene_type:complete
MTQSQPTNRFKLPDGRKARCLVIVPAYNESGSITSVVQGLHDHLPEVDVVVIDDGSVDRTYQHVPKSATVIRLPFNLGIGGAMQTGYRFAFQYGYDVAVQVDGDGQHPPSEVARLIDHLLQSNSDMVVGSRFKDTIAYRQTLSRMFGIHFLRLWIHLLTGKRFSDCTSGFRAANRHVIDCYAHWYPMDYPEPEVLVLLTNHQMQIDELQVHMEQRSTGQTSIPFHRGLFYVVKVAGAVLLDKIRDPWPHRKHKEVTP